MMDVTAIGEMLIDFAPRGANAAGYPVLEANPGGAPANFLAALTRFGGRAAMIAKVGDDAFGRMLTQTLRQAGIDTRGVVADPSCFTTLAFVSLDEKGNRDFSFARKPGADTRQRPEELDEALILESRALHFGTLSLTDDPARSATERAVALAKRHGLLVSVDPNLRKPLWSSEEKARRAMEWALEQADVVKLSDEEIDFLWGLSPRDGARKLLREYGVSLVYATLGPKGCYAACRGGAEVSVPAPEGIRAVDTTGAGDIFGGSAMSRLLRLGKAPADLTGAELFSIARFACAAASLSTLKSGGITSVPDPAEVEALLA